MVCEALKDCSNYGAFMLGYVGEFVKEFMNRISLF